MDIDFLKPLGTVVKVGMLTVTLTACALGIGAGLSLRGCHDEYSWTKKSQIEPARHEVVECVLWCDRMGLVLEDIVNRPDGGTTCGCGLPFSTTTNGDK